MLLAMLDAAPVSANVPKTNAVRLLVSILPWTESGLTTAGYCGTSLAHCRSPDCLLDYGRCDASKRPNGPPTTEIPRPHDGEAAYAPEIIRKCAVPGTVALTYDDGPHRYTHDLLDLLDKYNAKATFFVTGINNGKGPIDDLDLPWEADIRRMVDTGHQVASHTWSHQDLSAASHSQLREQMLKNEAAIRNILGSFPTYMRPPYSKCGTENGCLEEMGALGYHVILYDIDTKDYSNDHPDKIQQSKDIFDDALAPFNASHKSWMVIGHDVHEQTVHNLTEHMLKTLMNHGYRAVTVGECLNDPKEFWYRKDNHTPPRQGRHGKNSGRKTMTLDGACGRNLTCAGSRFGSCCSEQNFCGNTTEHCGTGCQPDFGHCPLDSSYISNNPKDDWVDDLVSGSKGKKGKPKAKSEGSSVRMGLGEVVLALVVVSLAMVFAV